ncbi:hypothetical protein AMTR_s00023p00223580 [Amborella trichopoda]|uniref:Uncharacterized protein n=1 Tax=Amborella trichopoda TaxID=13333 RepID=W1NJT5_AMBTC|nr:hypothetical protein AMTR_s00023p00223580 [Amborella trichopoda]
MGRAAVVVAGIVGPWAAEGTVYGEDEGGDLRHAQRALAEIQAQAQHVAYFAMSQRATAAGQGFGHGVGQGQGHGVGQVQGHGVIFWRGVRGQYVGAGGEGVERGRIKGRW